MKNHLLTKGYIIIFIWEKLGSNKAIYPLDLLGYAHRCFMPKSNRQSVGRYTAIHINLTLAE
jgi:hypothetical protein